MAEILVSDWRATIAPAPGWHLKISRAKQRPEVGNGRAFAFAASAEPAGTAALTDPVRARPARKSEKADSL